MEHSQSPSNLLKINYEPLSSFDVYNECIGHAIKQDRNQIVTDSTQCQWAACDGQDQHSGSHFIQPSVPKKLDMIVILVKPFTDKLRQSKPSYTDPLL